MTYFQRAPYTSYFVQEFLTYNVRRSLAVFLTIIIIRADMVTIIIIGADMVTIIIMWGEGGDRHGYYYHYRGGHGYYYQYKGEHGHYFIIGADMVTITRPATAVRRRRRARSTNGRRITFVGLVLSGVRLGPSDRSGLV